MSILKGLKHPLVREIALIILGGTVFAAVLLGIALLGGMPGLGA